MLVLARAVAARSALILGSLVLGSSIGQSPWTGKTGRQAICFRDRQVSLGTLHNSVCGYSSFPRFGSLSVSVIHRLQ